MSCCRYDSSKTIDVGCEFGVGSVVNALVSVAAGPTLNNYLFMLFAIISKFGLWSKLELFVLLL